MAGCSAFAIVGLALITVVLIYGAAIIGTVFILIWEFKWIIAFILGFLVYLYRRSPLYEKEE